MKNSSTIFKQIAAERDWTDDTQINILLDIIDDHIKVDTVKQRLDEIIADEDYF